MWNKFFARMKGVFMPSFNRQIWNGYGFRLSPSGFIRTILNYVYFINTIYLNNQHITYDLFVYAPKDKYEIIQYEWQIYDKKTKEPIKLDGNPKRTGTIEFVKDKSKMVMMSEGRKLEKALDAFYYKVPYYRRIYKAINLGYVVDDMRCYIKVKFKIGNEEFETEPLTSFNVYDKDDWQKVILELVIATFIGIVIGLITGNVFH